MSVIVGLSACSIQMGALPAKSDAMFLSRKPVEGLAECIGWGWDNQKLDQPGPTGRQTAIPKGIRLAADGGKEHLDLTAIEGKTEINLYLKAGSPGPDTAKRVAVVEACL